MMLFLPDDMLLIVADMVFLVNCDPSSTVLKVLECDAA